MVLAWGLYCEVAVKMSAESTIIGVSDWAGGSTSKLLTHMTVGRKPQFLPEDLITGLFECLHNMAFVFSRVRELTEGKEEATIYFRTQLWKSHTMISSLPQRLHRAPQFNVGGDYPRL